ncbi:hypothetical protein ACPPVT_07455 [Angustibacter sp. McL0619]|uniref:hypothetical protein n=1 Tax=Angustibacter sp. McL0619 TaxID=3415676 RepID=UPI003CE97518
MTTVSRPVVASVSGPDANIDHVLWRTLFDDAGGIVLADGSASGLDINHSGDLRLTLSAVDDTATVGVGYYRYRGFELHVSPAHGLTLAAVTGSAKTYLIGVMYNPANESTDDGPLSLYAALDTAVTIPSGGSFRKVWGVTRQPSQVLSLAAKADYRQYVGPQLWAPPGVRPSDAALGTRLHDGVNDWLRVRNAAATGGEWKCLTLPDWDDLSLTGSVVTGAGLTPRIGVAGGRVWIEGQVKRSVVGANFVPDSDVTLFTLPDELCPARLVEMTLLTSFSGASTSARLQINTNGVVILNCADSTPWVQLDGCSWFPKAA